MAGLQADTPTPTDLTVHHQSRVVAIGFSAGLHFRIPFVLMRVVNVVERVLREVLHPAKINLAALGNVVPHLHWHVIARFDWDSHFPAPIWGQAQRTVEPGQLSVLEHLMPRADQLIRQRLLPW